MTTTETAAPSAPSAPTIYYKCVRYLTSARGRTYKPATSLALQSIRYRLGETTEPADSGPLAVFETLVQARAWGHGDVILACEIAPSAEAALWKRNPPTWHRPTYRGGRPWCESAGTSQLDLDECPAGTVLADSVRVLRVVPDSEVA